jgi:hypothetical protein
MADIEIEGGLYGMNIGNQQFTMRNIKISKAVTGISQIWNWGWLYSGLSISNCGTAFSMSNGAQSNKLEVGSVVIIDSEITNCPTFVDMAWTLSTVPSGAGQLIMENIRLNNVPVAVKRAGTTVLQGGSITIPAWGQGSRYVPNGPAKFQGALATAARPQDLLSNGKLQDVINGHPPRVFTRKTPRNVQKADQCKANTIQSQNPITITSTLMTSSALVALVLRVTGALMTQQLCRTPSFNQPPKTEFFTSNTVFTKSPRQSMFPQVHAWLEKASQPSWALGASGPIKVTLSLLFRSADLAIVEALSGQT